jgi:hypothetical protein
MNEMIKNLKQKLKLNLNPKKKIFLSLGAAAVFIILVVLFIYILRGTGQTVAKAQFETNALSDHERFDKLTEKNNVLFPKYNTVVSLAMADGPGRPKSQKIKTTGALGFAPETKLALHSSELNDAKTNTVESAYQETGAADIVKVIDYKSEPAKKVVAGPSSSLSVVTPKIPQIIRPDLPTDNDSLLTVLTPGEGEVLYSGADFKLTWSLNSGRSATYNVFISTDNGRNFSQLTSGLAKNEYVLTVPNTSSSQCCFRVDAYVGSVQYATDLSDKFSIAPKVTTQSSSQTTEEESSTNPGTGQADNSNPLNIFPFTPSEDLGYVKSGNLFIDKDQDGTRWFSLDIKAKNAKKIVWQISKIAYSGLNSEALDPPGLIASGELQPDQTEFALDFNAIVGQLTKSQSLSPIAYSRLNREAFNPPGLIARGQPQTVQTELAIGTNSNVRQLMKIHTPASVLANGQSVPFKLSDDQVLLPQKQYTFYLRAIAFDESGNLIGDAGKGMSTGYGSSILAIDEEPVKDNLLKPFVETWSEKDGESGNGHSQYTYFHQVDNGIYAHPDDKYWDFEFRSTPEKTQSVEIQIATSPFGTDEQSYLNPQGLVYRNIWGKQFTYITNPFRFRIPLIDFVPPVDQLGTNTIRYYVRMLFFRPAEDNPALIYPIASETQIIYYNNLELASINNDLKFKPTQQVTVKSGVPFTTFQYYKPVQWEHPQADQYFEVSRRIMAEEMVLRVTTPNQTIYPYPDHLMKTGISMDQYQQLLDEVLPVGTSFKLTVNTSFWDEFWGLLGDIYNSVRQAYEDLKDSVPNFVADNFPFLGDKAREALRSALSSAVSVGLTAIGLPPTLPDFEMLASEGFGYCLEVAIDEACKQYNISSNELTDELRKQITNEFKAKMGEIAKINNANPLDVGYLKPAGKYRYRPACLVVFVQNCTDKVSPRGTLTANYRALNHFTHFYKQVTLPVPELQPGSNTTIYYNWAPNISTPWADFKPPYDKYYYGNGGECEFSMNVTYDVPNPETLAAQQNLKPDKSSNPLMTYEYVYDHSPVYTYSYRQPPCEWKTGGDDSVDIMDYIE